MDPLTIALLLGGASLIPSLFGQHEQTTTTQPTYNFDPTAMSWLNQLLGAQSTTLQDPLKSAGWEEYKTGLMGQFKSDVIPQVTEPFAASGMLRGTGAGNAAVKATTGFGNILAQQALPMQQTAIQTRENALQRLLQMAQLRQSGFMMPQSQQGMTGWGAFSSALPGLTGQILGSGIGAGWFG